MVKQPGTMTHTFNASTQVAKAGRSLSLRSAGATQSDVVLKKRKKRKEVIYVIKLQKPFPQYSMCLLAIRYTIGNE